VLVGIADGFPGRPLTEPFRFSAAKRNHPDRTTSHRPNPPAKRY
jgi:hypothetical protein